MYGIGFFELLIVLVLFLVPALAAIVIIVMALRRGASRCVNPNLTPCPDCQRFVSIRASSCPHCGAPLE